MQIEDAGGRVCPFDAGEIERPAGLMQPGPHILLEAPVAALREIPSHHVGVEKPLHQRVIADALDFNSL